MTAAILAQIAAQTRAQGDAKPPTPPSRRWQGTDATTGLKTRKTSKHEEDALQAAVVTWFDLQYPELGPLLFAVPNGGKRSQKTNPKTGKTWSPEATRLKKTGTRAGVSDLVLAVVTTSGPGLFLELKVGKNKPSDAQLDFLSRAKRQGYATAVAYDFNAARAAIQHHIGY